jgi:uncharacterized protein YndB with AHSA1/START domain
MSSKPPTKSPDFVISRVFDAPRELVWKCFTEPERMKEWWGPKGFKSVASKMDLRPGGRYHYCLQSPSGAAMWGKLAFREIVPPERMVLITSFSDEAGGTTAPSAEPGLAAGDVLDLHLRGAARRQDQAHDPLVAAQRDRGGAKDLRHHHDSMRMGWSGSLEQLETYLAKARQG